MNLQPEEKNKTQKSFVYTPVICESFGNNPFIFFLTRRFGSVSGTAWAKSELEFE